jgi:hypothetical protein
MDREKAIIILERSNDLLRHHMERLRTSLKLAEDSGMADSPVNFYESLANCQEEYEAVEIAISVLKEQQTRAQQKSGHFEFEHAQRDIVNFLSDLSVHEFGIAGLKKGEVLDDHELLSELACKYQKLVNLNAIKRPDACRFICESYLLKKTGGK